MVTASLRSPACDPGDGRAARLRDRVWHPTEARVRLLAELSLLADEAGYDRYIRAAAAAVAEHAGGACVIALRRGDANVLSVASHVSRGGALFVEPVSPFPEMARHVLQAGRGPFIEAKHLGERGEALVVPLRTRGRVTGALGAMTNAHVSADGGRYLHEVCARITVTVELMRLDGGDGTRTAPAPVPVLSARERQVLARVAEGMTSREAAAQLGISRRTVEWHRERIKEKLGVSGRVALTRAAREGGLG